MTIPALPALDRTSPTFRTDLDTFFLTQLPNTVTALNAEFTRLDGVAAGAFTGTSGASRTIASSGSFTFGVVSGTTKAFAVGQRLVIAAASAPSNQMRGYVTAYTSATGELVVAVDESSGSGTFDLWSIAVTAPTASPYCVGDVVLTNRALPAPAWLPADGAIYSQGSYAALYAELGLLRDGVYEPFRSGFSVGTRTPLFTDGRYMQRAGHHCFYAGLSSSTTDHDFYRSVDGVTAVSKATLPGLASAGLYALGGQNSACVLMVPPNGNEWLARSTDNGVTFAKVTLSGLANPYRLVVVNDTFVLFTSSSTTYYTSTDGVSWAGRTMPALLAVYAAVVENGLLVAPTNSSATIYTTPDAIIWTGRTLSFTPASGPPTFVYKDSVWLAYHQSTAQLARSTDDCVTWSNVTMTLGVTTMLAASGNRMLVFAGKFIGGVTVSGNVPRMYQSADGLTWQQVFWPTRLIGSMIDLMVVGSELVWAGADTASFAYATTDLVAWRQISQVTYAPTTITWQYVGELNGVQLLFPQLGGTFYCRPVYTYNSATQFAVPQVPVASGVTAYIKT